MVPTNEVDRHAQQSSAWVLNEHQDYEHISRKVKMYRKCFDRTFRSTEAAKIGIKEVAMYRIEGPPNNISYKLQNKARMLDMD